MKESKKGKSSGRKKKETSDLMSERLNLKLTLADKSDLEQRAKRFNVDLSVYCRAQLFRKDLNQFSRDYRKLIVEVNRIGVNLNQLVKALQAGGMTVVNTALEAKIDEFKGDLYQILKEK